MRKPAVSQLVYNVLFPKPRSNDPTNFASHIMRNLVPEVRVEIATFYGSSDCIEAQYPGLDYSFPPHRMRLSRFHHHRKLFKAFDELRLTAEEIAVLCRWEGTKFARDRYEREARVHVRDTTVDGILVQGVHVPASVTWYGSDIDSDSQLAPSDVEPHGPDTASSDTTAGEESSEDELEESVGFALNQHLLEATAARERGANVSLDDVWEQWLKDAIERGNYEDILHTIRDGSGDFSRAIPSPSAIYANNVATRQVMQRAPSTALTPGLHIPDPSAGPQPNSR
ncbi:conserved hypothetical protein [Uncinocarpus reesii 1704]|uniref:Uncharacterized protein n=1 Tax=Uncinocarpus reesii (strain UAMH 1704) TaxID=336963 RepID=C4JVM2_UNCRE|nr:uncharacterized protein UREG_06614 [Uncinocarpus reesii 1704]EEP81749.1 conserved hypothetical protein [Uncinocarpus reesii 1704]